MDTPTRQFRQSGMPVVCSHDGCNNPRGMNGKGGWGGSLCHLHHRRQKDGTNMDLAPHRERSKSIGAGLSRMYSAYCTVERRIRKSEFGLSIEKFVALTNGFCHYCGCDPEPRKHKGVVYYANGIDRVNSDLGHVDGNCVSCCMKCNEMKMDTPYPEFISRIQNMAKHISSKTRKRPKQVTAQLEIEL